MKKRIAILVVSFSLAIFAFGKQVEKKNVKALYNLSSSKIKVKISWIYKNFPANGKVKIYEPIRHKAVSLWTTQSESDINKVPISKEIKDSVLYMNRGAAKRFVLVMKNDTNKPVYFFATPHQATPVEHALGFKFRCLCIDHAFSAGKNEIWYRVVQLRLSPNFEGDSLEITHTLVAISEERMRKFNLN